MPASAWPAAKKSVDDAPPRERLSGMVRAPVAAPAAARHPGQDAPPDGVLGPLASVAAREDLLPLAQRLQELRLWLASDLAGLEQELVRHGHGSIPGLDGSQTGTGRAAQHLLNLAGKRIRPLCVILAARLGGRSMDEEVRAVASACELVHAATLLHDDVVDDSHERRGAPAARVIFGNSASILAGDHLLVHALRLVDEANKPALLRSLLEIMARMVRAEALQLERRGRFEPSRESYLEVIRGKTAALFAWGLSAGGVLGGCDAAAQAALERVGNHLGMAFQLVDDVLDMEGDPSTTGKEALQDLREGKLTWPLILAAERVPALAQELGAIARHGGDDAQSEADQRARIVWVLSTIASCGALEATRAFALQEAEAACACLQDLPEGRAREALRWVVQSAVHRLS